MINDLAPRIPDTSTAWQLWHRDLFDRDAPLSLQASGTDIVQGLYQLWRCTLKEGILNNGNASFSRFQLSWGNTPVTRVDIFVNPFDNPALLKLRQWAGWMPEDQESEDARAAQTIEEQKDVFLLRVAQLHYDLLQRSIRWNAAEIDWSMESREVLARVELIAGPEEL